MLAAMSSNEAHDPSSLHAPSTAAEVAGPAVHTRRRAALELLALATTGAAFAANAAAQLPRRVFIAGALGVWATYAYRLWVRDPAARRRWGFAPTRADEAATWRQAAAVSAAACAAILAAPGNAAALRAACADADFWRLLAVYPLWGITQEWLVLGIGARAVETLLSPLVAKAPSPERMGGLTASPERMGGLMASPQRRAREWTAAIVGVLFGLLHVAALDSAAWTLAPACLLMGVTWTHFFLAHACVSPLGFFHGILGTLFYFVVLRVNPLRDL